MRRRPEILAGSREPIRHRPDEISALVANRAPERAGVVLAILLPLGNAHIGVAAAVAADDEVVAEDNLERTQGARWVRPTIHHQGAGRPGQGVSPLFW